MNHIPERKVDEVCRIIGGASNDNLVSRQLELLIDQRRQQGFALESWQYGAASGGGTIVESIVAVFVRVEAPPDPTERRPMTGGIGMTP